MDIESMRPEVATNHDHDLTCNQCQRTYSRLEHLRRHLLSHSAESFHRCRECQKVFKRKDTLLRHLSTCFKSSRSSFQGNDRACDRCAGKKRRCSHERPNCKRCIKAGLPCFYPITTRSKTNLTKDSSLEASNSSPVSTSHAADATRRRNKDCDSAYQAQSQIESNLVPIFNSSEAICRQSSHSVPLQLDLSCLVPVKSFDFLLRFTTSAGLKLCFNSEDDALHMCPPIPGTCWPELPIATNAFIHSSDCVEQESARLTKPIHPDNTLKLQELRPCTVSGFPDNGGLRSNAPRWAGMSEISLILQQILSCKFQPLDPYECDSPDFNLAVILALDMYWSSWHPNWPVMHKPSFIVERTPAVLLLAMVTIGTCYCDQEQDQDLLDTIEELIFDSLQSLTQLAPLFQKIQTIQAAYIVCIFQTWEGNTAAKTRIRRHGFGQVVAAVRDLDLASIKHQNMASSVEDFDWIDFVRMEECIRTVLWVFLLDAAYLIFHNMPPRLALRELGMGLASSEMCYQAPSSDACFTILQAWRARNVRTFEPTLYGLIKIVLNPRLDNTVIDKLAHESFMNLWCVSHAFHIILFNLDPVIGGEQQFRGLQTAMDTWMTVWKRRMANNDERFFDSIVSTAVFNRYPSGVKEAWQNPGFWKNAVEYWLLARKILERMIAAQGSAAAAQELSGCAAVHVNVSTHIYDRIEDGDMSSIRAFLATVAASID